MILTDTKPHYHLLDGLRGVAALMVVWYHVFEGFATSPIDQKFNHGYLAVDFFFILSGFVIGYAYDDRWKKNLKTTDFFKRRLIRLHPMVVIGAILGAVTFIIQGCETWSHEAVSLSMVLLALLFNLFLIPVYPGTGAEVRGNGEMYPLDGPAWSLFFEYIANIIYALFLRRLSTKALTIWVIVTALGLSSFALFNLSGSGNIGVGWTMAGNNLLGGFLRVSFAFSIGLLMSRIFRPIKVKGIFWICTLIIIILLSTPHIGGEKSLWQNAIYDSVCVILIFPALVYLGASGTTTDTKSTKICTFLGKISYPLYIIHYPFMYLFYAWVWDNSLSFGDAWYMAVIIFVGSITLAYIFLKLYDMPIRKYLTHKTLR